MLRLRCRGAGLAGLTQFGALGTVDPSQGSDLQLIAIVVAVVGGTSLLGGRGSVLGSAMGALIVAAAYTGLVEAGLSATWFESFIGAVLLLAVIIVILSSGAGPASAVSSDERACRGFRTTVATRGDGRLR